jgi:DEAD/DEAH box helicase domain-containing protein
MFGEHQPSRMNWPEGFAEMMAAAEAGAIRPRDLDMIANLGLNSPHLAFPLRHVSEASYAIKNARTGQVIGSIEGDKALREAHPGAVYRHMGVPMRVEGWSNSSFDQVIHVRPLKSAEKTTPLIRTLIGTSFAPAEILDDHILTSDRGCFAETRIRVAQSVEGYRNGSATLLYKDLKDRRLSRKQREYGSTGVVLTIEEEWFAGKAEHQTATRRQLAETLKIQLTRMYSISPGEINTAHTGIAIYERGGARKVDNSIVVFDGVLGGLRLSTPVFREFDLLLGQLEKGAAMAGVDALLPASTIERLRDWRQSLRSGSPVEIAKQVAGDDEILVYAPQSEVGVRYRGQLLERRLIEPQFLATAAGEQLMYRYEVQPGVQAWVAHDQVEPIGHDWRRVLWNPLTNNFREA